MNYNFYASELDKVEILNFIFEETDLKLFDLGSEFGKEICQYKSTKEIASKFDLTNGDKFALTFQLWSKRHDGRPIFRKIKLDPKRCNGHEFRYSTDGWGLIQLYFGGIKNKSIQQSHIGHFNEKGALKSESSTHFNGKVNQWNWIEISRTSRRLKNHLHNKMAVKRIGSFGLLKGANELIENGIKPI